MPTLHPRCWFPLLCGCLLRGRSWGAVGARTENGWTASRPSPRRHPAASHLWWGGRKLVVTDCIQTLYFRVLPQFNFETLS